MKVGINRQITRGEQFAPAQQIFEPQLQRVEAQALRHDVHLRLVGPGELRHTVTTEGDTVDRIGVDGMGIDVQVWNAIWSASGIPSFLHHAWPYVRIGANLIVRRALARHNGAVALYASFYAYARRSTAYGLKTLLNGERQAHRAPQLACQRHHEGLNLGVGLIAVGAAEIGHDHLHAR